MPKLTVELETVTPLFLGGADPRGKPELRPPAFRGALRYWLRAVLGGVVGDKVEAVHQAEAAVFGSAAEEARGASAVTVRVSDNKLSAPQPYEKQAAIWVNRRGDRIRQPTGRDYLYWTMAGWGDKQPPKQFYPTGGTFELVLSSRSDFAATDQIFTKAVAALWLLLQLGGIGSRSRRTAGSLSVKRQSNFLGLQFLLRANALAEAAKELGLGLTTIRKQFYLSNSIYMPSSTPSFDILHPQSCRVWVLGMWDQSAQAVEAIGAAFRDFRTYSEPDHTKVAKWLNGAQIDTVQRAVFGLPLPYRYSDRGPAGEIRGRLDEPSIERRASPLWLKVSKTMNGRYVGVATLFKSAFLPTGEKLYAKVRRQNNLPPPVNPPSDYALIEKWVATSFPKGQEVFYD